METIKPQPTTASEGGRKPRVFRHNWESFERSQIVVACKFRFGRTPKQRKRVVNVGGQSAEARVHALGKGNSDESNPDVAPRKKSFFMALSPKELWIECTNSSLGFRLSQNRTLA